MATLKIVLKKDKKDDGTYPLVIRITHNRKTTFIYLNQSIKETDWDAESQTVKRSNPAYKRLNSLLVVKLAEASKKAIELELKNESISSKAVKQEIKPVGDASFFSQAAVYLKNLKTAGKYNIYVSEDARLNIIREFIGGKNRDIAFSEIDIAFLNRLKAYLKGVRQVKERTVMNYFVLIRTIYNQAIAAKLANRTNYPFGKDGISIKYPSSVKIGLAMNDVSALETIDLSDNEFHNHARNIWLLSFYFAGVRAGDSLLLKWSDFQNDRLYYSMNKNEKAGSLKLSDKALAILNQYKGRETRHNLVFPELTILDDVNNLYEVQRKTSYAVKRLDKALKEVAQKAKITVPLTMHIARHTFGNISGDKIPVQMLQKLYRHSSITTTIGYQANFIHKDTDDALDAVVGSF
ncbi:MAG TPA: site-specific integrase [Flavipsychrobacter sp.]|nr:site-specific integrase [Flavipsychrobacter sp.]